MNARIWQIKYTYQSNIEKKGLAIINYSLNDVNISTQNMFAMVNICDDR